MPDASDQCPNTPAGEAVNSRGCSGEKDTDRDGVPDIRDQCGSTPAGQAVDANGCPILFQKGARSVILRGVTFQTGRATLTPEARIVLKDIADQLVDNPQYRVQISGHTDNKGTRAKNLRLSLARARTVETFLAWSYFGLKDSKNFVEHGRKAKALGQKEATLLGYLARIEAGEPIK